MIIRLAAVTTMIACFALSFSALIDLSRQRSFDPSVSEAHQDCLAAGLFCAPGGNRAVN